MVFLFIIIYERKTIDDHSPQPHLDARYTVFGHVVNGIEVVDRIQPWDVIRRVQIWDGTTLR